MRVQLARRRARRAGRRTSRRQPLRRRIAAAQPTRASEPPTLTRRTPRSAYSASVIGGVHRQHVERLRRDRPRHRADVLGLAHARRIEAVRARRGEGDEAVDGLRRPASRSSSRISVRATRMTSAPAASMAQRAAAAAPAPSPVIERAAGLQVAILDRKAGDAGLDGEPHAFGHALGLSPRSRIRNRR